MTSLTSFTLHQTLCGR